MTDQPSIHSVPIPAARQRHLFVIRMWWEPDDESASGEWRGSIEHVPSRTRRYFRDLGALPELVAMMMGMDQNGPGETGLERSSL